MMIGPVSYGIVIGIPFLFSAYRNNKNGTNYHQSRWFEILADILGGVGCRSIRYSLYVKFNDKTISKIKIIRYDNENIRIDRNSQAQFKLDKIEALEVLDYHQNNFVSID